MVGNQNIWIVCLDEMKYPKYSQEGLCNMGLYTLQYGFIGEATTNNNIQMTTTRENYHCPCCQYPRYKSNSGSRNHSFWGVQYIM